MSERHHRILTPGKASLVMLGLGTIALMGIPGVGAYEPPTGSVVGIVLQGDGAQVPDVPVALFDGESLALLEVVHSDDHGRFAFQQAPPTFHLFAHPEVTSELVGTWKLSVPRREHHEVEVRLTHGRPVHVTVTDEGGQPIEGAEVRAYDADPHGNGTTVVVRTKTDANGEASFSSPEYAHIGVVGHDHHYLSGWRFDARIESEGAHFEFHLPAGSLFHGRVLGPATHSLPGILVSSWDQRDDGWQWNGYQLTDRDGRFDLPGAEDRTVLRAVDLTQSYLPLLVPAEVGRRQNVLLARGEPLRIQCTDREAEGVPSRV